MVAQSSTAILGCVVFAIPVVALPAVRPAKAHSEELLCYEKNIVGGGPSEA